MTISISPIFIMHYCVFVLIPQDADIDIEIEKALAPFDDDLKVDPYKVYLDPREITAMARHYGTKRSALKQLATHMEDWRSGLGGVDDRGLFAVSTFNPNAKWDWYAIGGRWHGHLPGNVMSAATLLKRPDLKSLLPAALVTPGGTWHQRETFVVTSWFKGHFDRKSDREWLTEVREALESSSDYRVVCVDVHN